MIWNKKNAGPAAEVNCEYASVNLSRYLDNDLAGADAIAVAAHLHGCLSCRNAFETMRAQQGIVSALPVPPGARAARDRVLRRLESGVRVRRTGLSGRALRLGSRGRFSIAAASLAACGIVSAAFVVTRHSAPMARPSPVVPVAVVPSFVPRQLPAAEEMTRLFALHDKQVSASARALAPAPAAVHKIAARRAVKKSGSRVSSESHQARVARLAAKVVGDNLALEQGNRGAISAEYLASDDVPEAL